MALIKLRPKRVEGDIQSGMTRQPAKSFDPMKGPLKAGSLLADLDTAENFRKFKEYTQAFDDLHGTKLWDAAVSEGVPH